MSPTKRNHDLNPRTNSYKFLGPPGALFITLAAPLTIYALCFGCSEQSGGSHLNLQLYRLINRVPTFKGDPTWQKGLWDMQATLVYLAWYAFCVIAWAILPGDQVEGLTMRNGEKKKYKMNGFATFLLAMGLICGAIYRWGPRVFTFIYSRWIGLVTASVLMAVAQAALVYAMSFGNGKLLALGGNTGNFIYDFFIGRELNPSVGSFDIKSFNEMRPGLILWVLIDISMACEQAVRRGGSLANVTDSMWLVLAFQTWYVADALYNEPAVLTTMDITTDGFGFMLAFGDLAWVPFVYSLQARYLVFNQVELGPMWASIILGVNTLGYYIFRTANGEKNDFRNGKNPKDLKYLTTASGSKLLISGWWGRSRHPNYLGDLIMALSWSLPTGFETPITYFYVMYFSVLLIHRQHRDEEHCGKKYGADWEKYKKTVPYRIIPYIY